MTAIQTCNSDSRGRLREEGGQEAGYFLGGVSYLGKEEGICRRDFLFSVGLVAQESPVFDWGRGGCI